MCVCVCVCICINLYDFLLAMLQILLYCFPVFVFVLLPIMLRLANIVIVFCISTQQNGIDENYAHNLVGCAADFKLPVVKIVGKVPAMIKSKL